MDKKTDLVNRDNKTDLVKLKWITIKTDLVNRDNKTDLVRLKWITR